MSVHTPLRLRIQDVLLAVMFGALIFLTHDAWETGFMVALAALQLIEGRVDVLDRPWGRAASVLVQLTIGYLLIGITGGVESPYYLALLLPVVSTASYLGFTGTVVSSVVAIGAYLSFLLFIDWNDWVIDPESMHVLAIRCLLPAVAAVLVNSLGDAARRESARYKNTAEQLAEANRNLSAAQAEVRRTERLAALGQLSAGLAHEIRNPLGSIKGSADLLTRFAAKESAVVQELAGIISAEVDRTNLLVTRFLDFARPLEPRRELTDITRIIDDSATHAGVTITRDFAPSLPLIPLDPALMEQVFINLITNAKQASENGTPVTVRARQCDGQAEVSVIDQGVGIPADRLEAVFNPFMTTKQNGVGLGLAIVARIVHEHGGRIAVDSEPGKGATFRVTLPCEVPVIS